MKFLSAILLMASVSTGAMASQTENAPVRPANTYVCKGKDVLVMMNLPIEGASEGNGSMAVTSTSSDTSDLLNTLVDFKVTEVATGYQATGRVPYIADANLTYTLIVPRALVASPMKVKGMLVRTWSGGMFGPIANVPRLLENNTFLPVSCEVSAQSIAP